MNEKLVSAEPLCVLCGLLREAVPGSVSPKLQSGFDDFTSTLPSADKYYSNCPVLYMLEDDTMWPLTAFDLFIGGFFG